MFYTKFYLAFISLAFMQKTTYVLFSMLTLHVFDFEPKINNFDASQMFSFVSDDIFLKSIVFSQKSIPT